VQKIYQHIVATREAEKPHVEVDPRFDAARAQAVDEAPAVDSDDPRFR